MAAHEKFCKNISISILLLLLSMSLSAKEDNTFDAGSWNGFYQNDKDGGFNFCSINSSYKDGTGVFFIINNEYELLLGLRNDKWSYTPGSTDSLMVEIDNKKVGKFNSEVTNSGTGFRVELGKTNDWTLNRFKYGKRLKIAGSSGLHFKLTGTKYALDKLKACYEFRAQNSNPSQPNIFSKSSKVASKKYNSNFQNGLKIYLVESGLTEVELFTP